MNESQLALCRRLFANWVETTDVAEQCGLTREAMIDSVDFGDPEEFNHLHVLHRGYIDEIREGWPWIHSTENQR